MKYKFKWRKKFFWTTCTVIGHRYDADHNKMIIYFENGGLREIADWKNCEVTLGQDWVLAQKKALEAEAGTSIPLKVAK